MSGIFRGTGGTGDADANVTINEITQLTSDAQLAQAAAEAAQTYSEEWANKAEDSLVSTAAGGDGVDDYSSMHWSKKSEDEKIAAEAAKTAAETAQTAAETAQTGAETAETNAVTAKNAAETAQTGAETAETNAAASEAAAAASYDSFDDRYLGSKTSDPTLDNDGNALLNGALYWNSVSATMLVYDTGTGTWGAIENLAKASTTQAEAGTDDVAYMTPAKSFDQLNSLPRKNFIINGGKKINQRVVATNTTNSGEYNFDRWFYDGTYLYQSVAEEDLFDGRFTVSWESDATCEYQLISTATASSGLSSITTGWTSIADLGSFTLVSTAGTNLWLRFTTGLDGLNALTNLQLEEGEIATDFERRSYGEELALCQRYYEKTYNHDTALGTATTVGQNLITSSGTTVRMYHSFKVSKRVSPTVTLYSPITGASGVIYTNGADASAGASSSQDSFFISGVGTADQQYTAFHMTASSEL